MVPLWLFLLVVLALLAAIYALAIQRDRARDELRTVVHFLHPPPDGR